MVYRVVFSRGAKRSIDKLEEVEKKGIRGRIGELMGDPYKAGKPLKGPFRARNVWSSRAGDYRILYIIFDDEQTVLVIRVDKRRRVYRI